jgi:hypothetical protein
MYVVDEMCAAFSYANGHLLNVAGIKSIYNIFPQQA